MSFSPSKEMLCDINSCNLFDCKGLEIMLRKVKPELTIYLAEEALKKKFADESISLQVIVELQRDCRDYLSTQNLRKIYARMMKMEVSMIKLLKRIIEFAEKYDSAREFINVGGLEAIKERHDRYFQLLKEIDGVLKGNGDSVHQKIIMCKIQSPNEKIEALAARCNVDKSIVSRHLKSFVGEMRKYLE